LLKRVGLCFVVLAFVTGCASSGKKASSKPAPKTDVAIKTADDGGKAQDKDATVDAEQPVEFDLAERMSTMESEGDVSIEKMDTSKDKMLAIKKPEDPELDLSNLEDRIDIAPTTTLLDNTNGNSGNKLFSFRARKMNIRDALRLFARANDLNMIIEPEIRGNITVKFKNLPFKQAMEAILDSYGFYWSQNNGLYKVFRYETKIFHIDYVDLSRKMTGTSSAGLLSSGTGGTSTGDVSITQNSTSDFWKTLKKQLKGLVTSKSEATNGGKSMSGKKPQLVVNRRAGTIFVTDYHRVIVNIGDYLESLKTSMLRQVLIEVQIMEVTLNDEFSLGVNWSQLISSIPNTNIATTNIVTSPAGLAATKPASFALTYGTLNASNFNAVLEALQEQGEIKVVSKPKLLVMNNHPALIKVGTEMPFFRSTTTPGTGGSSATVTEEIEFITVGVVLSITPQISEKGWIMLDVTPIISRLVATKTSTFGSTAPVLDIKQSSTMVRVLDGQMASIGGMIQSEQTETTREIPLLGSIPFLGRLFQGTYTSDLKKELVVFITPRVVKNEMDNEAGGAEDY